MLPRTLRWSTLAVGAIIASTLAIPTAAHAAAPTLTSPAGQAEAWLRSQLQGNLVPGSYGPNYGASADTILSLVAIGDPAPAVPVAQALSADIDSYISGDAYGDAGSTYAKAVAKAAVAVRAAGLDPTSVNGENLITRLEATVQSSGRIQDTSAYGDYENVFGQAFAADALKAAGSSKSSAVTAFLLTQQCTAGWFREAFTNTVDSSYVQTNYDTACNADATSTASVDATATAVIELQSQKADPTVAAALAKATAWLASAQAADGGWKTDAAATSEDVDATGLATRALALSGNAAAAAKGATWVGNHQLLALGTCTSYPAADRGALAYDDAALADVSGGTATDQYRVAASQALPALAYLPTTTVTAPNAFAPTGSIVALSVTGGPACLDGALVKGGATKTVTLPSVTGTVSYSYVGAGTAGVVKVTALGAAKLFVDSRAKVRRGTIVKVLVAGLAAGEHVTAHLRSARATTVANDHGVAVLRLRAKGKPGKAHVAVTGEFVNRHGGTKVRIVR